MTRRHPALVTALDHVRETFAVVGPAVHANDLTGPDRRRLVVALRHLYAAGTALDPSTPPPRAPRRSRR